MPFGFILATGASGCWSRDVSQRFASQSRLVAELSIEEEDESLIKSLTDLNADSGCPAESESPVSACGRRCLWVSGGRRLAESCAFAHSKFTSRALRLRLGPIHASLCTNISPVSGSLSLLGYACRHSGRAPRSMWIELSCPRGAHRQLPPRPFRAWAAAAPRLSATPPRRRVRGAHSGPARGANAHLWCVMEPSRAPGSSGTLQSR